MKTHFMVPRDKVSEIKPDVGTITITKYRFHVTADQYGHHKVVPGGCVIVEWDFPNPVEARAAGLDTKTVKQQRVDTANKVKAAGGQQVGEVY